jgi:hypothetical protein
MSRFGSDDFYEEFPNQSLLWWHNAETHLAGAKGQKVLRELRDAMLAMPERKLIRGRLADEQGHVCAVGALAVARGESVDELAARITFDKWGDVDSYDAEDITIAIGRQIGLKEVMSTLLAQVNDDAWGAPIDETDEQRFERVLAWIEKKLEPEAVPA